MGIRDTFMKVFREALDESVTEVVDEYKRNGTLDRIADEAVEEFFADIRKEAQGQIIMNMLHESLEMDLIQRLSGWSAEDIRRYAKKHEKSRK